MSGTVNKVIIIGHLGRDPEVRRTQDGRPVVNMSIATSKNWRDKNSGERKEKTEWHRIVCFNEGLCKIAEQYLKKGAKVYIEGELQTRKWTDQGGAEKYTTEIILNGFNCDLTMLDSQRNGPPPNDGSGEDIQRYSPPSSGGSPGGARRNDMDDEIPF